MKLICLASILCCLYGCAESTPSRESRSDSGNADGGLLPSETGTASEEPPEQELESLYAAPVATSRFIWVANPSSGRVAYIDAASLKIQTARAGNAPTHVAAVPEQEGDATLVLNVLSEDATLLRTTSSGLETKRFRAPKWANAMAFSPDGKWALVWSDFRAIAPLQKTVGLQEVALLNLSQGESTLLSVGYRPVKVGFSAGRSEAHVVTHDGISIIDFQSVPLVSRNLPFDALPSGANSIPDVSVTPDGSVAIIRHEGSKDIEVVSLVDFSRRKVELAAPITDLDLNSKGTFIVAVLRSKSQVVIKRVEDLLSGSEEARTFTLPEETVGSVVLSDEGNWAILYSNSAEVERVTIVDLASPSPLHHAVRLYAPVKAVFFTPDGQHAAVVHSTLNDETSAFSLLTMAQSQPAKITATRAPIISLSLSNSHVIAVERDRAQKTFGAYLATLPQLTVQSMSLASAPESSGFVPNVNRAFISQKHPEGRLTVIDLSTSVLKTLTGFELASRMNDGSQP